MKTQNPNEAINKINGTKCPKMVSLHKNVLVMDVNAAVNQFNYSCFVIFFENGQINPNFTKTTIYSTYTPIFKLPKVTQLGMISHNLEIEVG